MTSDELLELATERHRAGDLREARRLYQQLLNDSAAATRPALLFQIGLLEFQEGRSDAALPPIQQAVAASPGESRFRFALGQVLAALDRWDEAAAAYRHVLHDDPRAADAHFALGRVLQTQKDYSAAIASYQAALDIRPQFAEAINNLGNCHQLLGHLSAAEAAYRQALIHRPGFATAMSNLGTVLLAAGQLDRAADLFRAAADLEPDAPLHAVNLGAALCRRRNFSDAASVLRRAVERDATNAEAAFNYGNALQGLGRPREAAEQYRNAAALRPDYADALINLGNVHKELGEFTLAAAAYQAAARAQPDSIPALNNAACLLRTLGRLDEAEAMLRRGLALDPRHPSLTNNLGHVLKDCSELDAAIDCFRQALALDPTDAAAHSNLAYALTFQSPEPQPILDECLRFNACHAAPLQSEIRPRALHRSLQRRLRIGYVSPDFRDHCQSLFTIPLLSHHDRAAFEIICYSSVERPDDFTRRIASHADAWRDVRPLDDAALADLIRTDQINILVDLTMHMSFGRPLVFARKPAPVQIAWLAYPGTTGLAAMDYRLSDPRLDPPGFDNHYSERTIRLPDSFWCYDPLSHQPDVNALPALSHGHLTLGCLNNPCKLTDHTLRLWAAVMQYLPGARLLLMAPPGAHRQRLLHRLAAHAIASERVNFLPYRPRAEYLRSYHDIDLGLDTFPYNGHTTSLDSFWMGVPVVTRVGRTCVGRGGLSQLFNLNLLELAADSDEAFVSAAVALAQDLPRLADLRQQLRPRLERSPLMDAARFARNIESAYRQAVDEY